MRLPRSGGFGSAGKRGVRAGTHLALGDDTRFHGNLTWGAGEHVPLTKNQIESLGSLANSCFDFSVQPKAIPGHIELVVRTATEQRNLADVGFGYSQLIPVIAQVWSAYGLHRKTKSPTVLAIEQPELHLHPAHQARLADLFVQAVIESRKLGQEMHIIIETHSEALINRIGELLQEKTIGIQPSDVQVLIFNKHNEPNVTVGTFNHDGELENWPYGFFSSAIQQQ